VTSERTVHKSQELRTPAQELPVAVTTASYVALDRAEYRFEYCAMRIDKLYKRYGRFNEALAMWTRLLDVYKQNGRL
jgi:hypothetical protein